MANKDGLMQHQGLYILAYLHQRHYDIDEVAELANLDPVQLAKYLQMPVLPDEILEKLAAVFSLDVDSLLGLPDARLN